MTSLLHRLGRSAALRPGRAIGIWFLVAVAVVALAAGAGRDLEDRFEVPGVDSHVATELLAAAGADSAGLTARVVVTPVDPSLDLADPSLAAELAVLEAQLAGLDSVVGVGDFADAVSPDGRVALVTVQYPVVDELDAADLERLRTVLDESSANGALRVEAGGDLFFAFEEAEQSAAELIGLGVAVAVLLVAFGSLIAAGLPIGMALFGLALGIAAMPLVAHLIEIPSWAPQMATMIGLGVGIDYALFLVTRHREFLARGMTVPEAAGRAVATSGQAVVFAGGTVVIAILGLGVAGVPFMTAAGVATSVIVLLMVAASITLLPAFLGLAGHRIERFGLHRRGVASSTRVSERWLAWGRHVTRHAWSYTIGVTALLVALAAPVVALDLGFADEGTFPDSRTERRAYDLVAEGFGAGTNGPLVIAVDLGEDPTGASAEVTALLAAVEADPGVAWVATPTVDADAAVATIVATPTTAPQDPATLATVERLRGEVFPAVLADSDVTAHVGGQTATFGDVAGRVSDRLAWFVGAVVLLSFLLLVVVFRSVAVALKAALLNLLSIGAAYGVLVAVFQWGWGKGLIGLETTVPIVSFVPMFMFAVLFGLSMDYEVFLLSRVREEYVATGDNDRSVITGVATTARVITSAALIMVAVFGGFVFASDPTMKMVGLGLAVAIAVDATVVRLVLVPATMAVLGDRNWWLPGWLDRRLPRIDIDGEAGLPDPEMEPVAAVPTPERVSVPA